MEVQKEENLLEAVKRVSKLNRMLIMSFLSSDSTVVITESDYKFIYETKPIKKLEFKTYKDHLKIVDEFRLKRVIPEYNPAPLRDVWDSKPTSKRPIPNPPPPPVSIGGTSSDLRASKQERQYLVWFLGTIIIALVLLLIYK